MSAARIAGASLMPSPRKPVIWPLARSARTMRSLCAGVSLANTLARSTAAASSAPSIDSIAEPSSTPLIAKSTSRQILVVTSSLSPVRTLTVMPCAASAASAGAVDSLGGSRNAM